MLDPLLNAILKRHKAARNAKYQAWHEQHAAKLEARRQAKNKLCGAKMRTGAPCQRRGGRCPSHCGKAYGRSRA